MGSSPQSSVTFSSTGSGVHAVRAFAARGRQSHGPREQSFVITAADMKEFERLRAKEEEDKIRQAASELPEPSQLRVDNYPVLALPPSVPSPSNRRMLPPLSSFRGGGRGSPPSPYSTRGGRGGGRPSN